MARIAPLPVCPALPSAPPAHPMPGYVAAVLAPLADLAGVMAAVVVEMDWEEEASSASYLAGAAPFEPEAMIYFTLAWGGVAEIAGYVYVPLAAVIAWDPPPAAS